MKYSINKVTMFSVLTSIFNPLLNITLNREKELLKKENSLLKLSAKIFENSTDGILITDSKNKIVTANPSFLRITGFSLNEIIGKNPSMFASGRSTKAFYENMWHSLNTTGKWNGILNDIRKDGCEYEKHMSIEVVSDVHGNAVNYISIHTDNTEKKKAEENIHNLAYYDVLTGLPNRTLLKDRLNQVYAIAHREHSEFSVLFLDLDHFKCINDTLGHVVGDLLLKAVANRIKSSIRAVDTVARIGGDEFVVILHESDKHGAGLVAQKIIDNIMNPFHLNGHKIVSKTSVGVAVYPVDGNNVDELVKNADIAMYHAKKSGRNKFKFFSSGTGLQSSNIFSIEKDIRAGLKNSEFFLEFQPQVELKSGQVFGVESLVRWNHPKRGRVSPNDFISVAEETGQIIQLGNWALRESCRMAKHWQDEGLQIIVSVNVSVNQLNHPKFVETVERAIHEFNVDAKLIDLELTEGIMIGNAQESTLILSRLRAIGVLISIDDFGTGFSNLNYLKRMPVTQLKIDKSFIDGIERDESDIAIVKTIISLGHQFNLKVIAEGVETASQMEIVYNMGCRRVQGYFYGKPMSKEVVISFIILNRGMKMLEGQDTAEASAVQNIAARIAYEVNRQQEPAAGTRRRNPRLKDGEDVNLDNIKD